MEITKMNYEPIVYNNDRDWQAAMRLSIETLAKCDAVALLPRWQASKGARIEQQLAVDLGMEVLEVWEWMTVRKDLMTV